MKRATFALAALLGILSGCVTMIPPAIDKNSKQVDLSAKSIVLLTFTVSRDDSRDVPKPIDLLVRTTSAKDDLRFGFGDAVNLVGADPDFTLKNGHGVYTLRRALAPGPYRLNRILGLARAFPFNGSFSVPLYLDVDVPARAIVYVGRVEATLRPRRDDEFRAGALIPLVDHAATGMSGGTFDVVVEDDVAEDLPLFRENYPVLANAKIETAILPPFDRARVQMIYDGVDKADTATQH